MPYCPACGEEVTRYSHFCSSCGAELTDQKDSSEETTASDAAGEWETTDSVQGNSGSRAANDWEKTDREHTQANTESVPADEHGLLIGGVVAVSILSLLAWGMMTAVQYMTIGTSVIGHSPLFAVTMLAQGALPLVALGATGYYYYRGRLDRTYFGLLTVIGGLGLFTSMWLIALAPVGIYGLTSVLGSTTPPTTQTRNQ